MRKNKFFPLYIIEGYLLFSLVLLVSGPLHFELHNTTQFVILIVLYHFAFVFGYLFGNQTYSPCRSMIFQGDDRSVIKRFNILIIVVLYVWIVVTRNMTHASSYLPIELFSKAFRGILNPVANYNINKGTDALSVFHGNKVMTGSVLLIYFLYYCFPGIAVIWWKKITKKQKIVSIVIIFLCLSLGFASGTNAMIFHVILPLSGGLLIKTVTRSQEELDKLFERKRSQSKRIKRTRRIVFIFLVFGLIFFVYNIDSRLSGNVLAYYTSKSRDITISNAYRELINDPLFSPFVKGLSSIQSYMCQGYYGMSLSLDQSFTTTYGIGHSFFLATSFDNMFGTEIIARTYQEKITDIWSRTVNWHSFYSQIANDVSFWGVIIVMFALGIIISKVWRDIIECNNPIAKLFFIVLIPLFVFIPMNNQLGNLYGTFFSFWVLYILWAVTRKCVLTVGSILRI